VLDPKEESRYEVLGALSPPQCAPDPPWVTVTAEASDDKNTALGRDVKEDIRGMWDDGATRLTMEDREGERVSLKRFDDGGDVD